MYINDIICTVCMVLRGPLSVGAIMNGLNQVNMHRKSIFQKHNGFKTIINDG